jgi:hypothetical protein
MIGAKRSRGSRSVSASKESRSSVHGRPSKADQTSRHTFLKSSWSCPIDIEFLRCLGSSPANQHLVKAIVSLTQGFGHQTIAEGVEDEETLTHLREYGVDFAQGFHLGRPAPIEGFTALLPAFMAPRMAPGACLGPKHPRGYGEAASGSAES